MLFRKDIKEKVIAENPGLNSIVSVTFLHFTFFPNLNCLNYLKIDLSKLIAAKWNALSAKKQEKYKNKAIKLRQEYEEELKEF